MSQALPTPSAPIGSPWSATTGARWSRWANGPSAAGARGGRLRAQHPFHAGVTYAAAIPRETFFYIRYFQEIVRPVSRRRSDLNAKTAIPFSDFPAGPDRGLAVIWPAGGDGPGVDGDRLLDQERQQGPRDPGLGSCLEGVERGTGALAGVDRCRKLENALGISVREFLPIGLR
jgi:hypothetical protein